ncbi:hypothetical protein [Thermosulfurimonas dismutans]|uniref:Uncharacterized protein n=1 Tax=Thermosulfurimonas dismutans TaxID=999894 RepID=A0A179D576_9BACT|nr:hypothetical protein [Thermosulfurimonas dismutans]OAQ20612.1 hypothetical protein TDIS_1227 [Thermosulfurimonas dismutans]
MKRAIRWLPFILGLTLAIFLCYKLNLKEKSREAPMEVGRVTFQRQESVVPLQMVELPRPKPLEARDIRRAAKKSSVQVKLRSRARESSGKRVLGNRSNEPVIVAEYGLPFEKYLEYMRRLGAQVVVYDVEKGRFVCSILLDGTLLPNPSLKGYSPRARRLTSDFPNREQVFQQVRELFGPGDYEILLLLPQEVEERFLREIKKALESFGYSWWDVLSVKIRYEEDIQGLEIILKEIFTPGKRVVVNYVFKGY